MVCCIHKSDWNTYYIYTKKNIISEKEGNKCIFSAIEDVPKDCYDLIGNLNISHRFEPEKNKLDFPIVDTINNNKYFNENNLYKFETSFKYDIVETKLFDINDDEINKIEDFLIIESEEFR